MTIKHILCASLATAVLAVAVPAAGNDIRDPGRIPKRDKDRDAVVQPVSVSTAGGAVTAKTEEDLRDPGHAVVPDKARDTVRRR